MLVPGTRIGPHEIVAPLGTGGMGEVYRAHDARLGRDVAVKVLPSAFAADTGRLQRFEQEARAAGALSHPNLVSVLDIGLHEGGPYIVFELLRGTTLRRVLDGGPPPLRRTLDYGAQIAQGLAAAHQKGIVHRDLKPENLFVTEDGRVKILDFGLAKLRRELDSGVRGAEATASEISEAGPAVGTVGYMSPEQVQGLPTDHRSDVFSLGCVLHELVSGRRAFKGPSAVDTLHAILRDEPPDASGTPPFAPVLDRIVRRCLEKNPDDRFQSAHDLAFALAALSGTEGGRPVTATPPRRGWGRSTAVVALLLALSAAAFLLGERGSRTRLPRFVGLSSGHGAVWSARFTQDAATVLYGARWGVEPLRVFSTRKESPESLALPIPDADVLALSSRGELAIALGRPYLIDHSASFATLATLPLAGSEPRERAGDVQSADYSPAGDRLAIIREVGKRRRLEYPIGNVLYETANAMYGVRIAPDGRHLALWEITTDGCYLAVFDLKGNRTLLGDGKDRAETLAWGPRSDEVWYASHRVSDAAAIKALDLQGRARSIAVLPGGGAVHDVARDGRALVVVTKCRGGVRSRRLGEARERDLPLSWYAGLLDLSADGEYLLYSDGGRERGEWTYFGRTDGSLGAVRLGEGSAQALSPDGRWALVLDRAQQQVLLPVRAGEPQVLATPARACKEAIWLPDGRRLVATCREGDRLLRPFVKSVDGGESRALAPEGTYCSAVSPDGSEVACKDPSGEGWIYPVAGGAPRPIPGLEHAEVPIQWAEDGESLFINTGLLQPLRRIVRLDLESGERVLVKELKPEDPGLEGIDPRITPDGRTYAYGYQACLGTLYLVEDLS
jgi:hypothetical protein